jgi:sortase A
MRGLGSAERAGFGIVARVLTWGGVLLLLVGGLLGYPYVSSRLAAFPLTSTPTPSPMHTSVPSPIVTSVTRTPAPTPVVTHTSTPTPAPTPTSTPAPAPPTRVVIPGIGVDAPVVPVSWRAVEIGGQTQTEWDVPAMYAAGWHETSAPLGVVGNTVLNGHNTTNGEVFRDLYTLDAGDVITVYADDIPYVYSVSEVLILPEADQPLEVRLKNARYILPTDDERLTLVTCHPYGSLRYRLVVIAHPETMTNDQRGTDE